MSEANRIHTCYTPRRQKGGEYNGARHEVTKSHGGIDIFQLIDKLANDSIA